MANNNNRMNNNRINKYNCMTYQDKKTGSTRLSTWMHKKICNTPDCVYNQISDVSNKANINIMEIINHLNTLRPNNRCLFMVNIIKMCASDNLAELIFRKIYDEYKNFSILVSMGYRLYMYLLI